MLPASKARIIDDVFVIERRDHEILARVPLPGIKA